MTTNCNYRFGRVPPLRSGPGFALRRAANNAAQRSRAAAAPGYITLRQRRSGRGGVSALRARIPHAALVRESAGRAEAEAPVREGGLRAVPARVSNPVDEPRKRTDA